MHLCPTCALALHMCTHLFSGTGVGRCRCHPGCLREKTSPPTRPTRQTCSPTQEYSDIQYGAHSSSGPRQAPKQAGWSSAYSHRNSSERWQETVGLEARWKHFGNILASEIRVRTCTHQLWYWPPLDSAGIPFFPLPFSIALPTLSSTRQWPFFPSTPYPTVA